jgi:hypothetical protein
VGAIPVRGKRDLDVKGSKYIFFAFVLEKGGIIQEERMPHPKEGRQLESHYVDV